MRALIIAGGPGVRLRPFTKTTPKCLIKVGGQTLLERIINSLLVNKIQDLVIITGHLEEQIKELMRLKYPNLKTIFFTSPNIKIKYLYPMWAARGLLEGQDILYLHGDLIFDPALAKRLIGFPHSGALIHKGFVSEKDFNARIENGLVTKIGVRISGEKTRFCLPFYKLLKDDFRLWMEAIGRFVKKEKLDCYAEEALNEILDKINFYPLYYNRELGMEIDDFEDLRKAEEFFKNEKNIQRSK